MKLSPPHVAAAAGRAARGVFATAAELLWPSACVGCGESLEPGGYFCARCADRPARLKPPFCSKCSRPFENDGTPPDPAGAGLCTECREQNFEFECAVNYCRHEELARELILRFKYGGEHYLRRPLGDWLIEILRTDARLRGHPVDALVPVPLHRARERERGFNQADALCRRMSRGTGLPVWRALRRVRATQQQSRLTREQRHGNLRGAFVAAPRWPVGGTSLLLVDDVFTTGSTVHECARVLRAAGAARVCVLTVTRR